MTEVTKLDARPEKAPETVREQQCTATDCSRPAVREHEYCSYTCAENDRAELHSTQCDLAHFPGAFADEERMAALRNKLPY